MVSSSIPANRDKYTIILYHENAKKKAKVFDFWKKYVILIGSGTQVRPAESVRKRPDIVCSPKKQCQLSSAVELRFCKPSVLGSNPRAGSNFETTEPQRFAKKNFEVLFRLGIPLFMPFCLDLRRKRFHGSFGKTLPGDGRSGQAHFFRFFREKQPCRNQDSGYIIRVKTASTIQAPPQRRSHPAGILSPNSIPARTRHLI